MSDNTSAYATLEAQIAALNSLETAIQELAPQVASELQKNIEANIAAGVDPGGNAWELTKKGKVPMRKAGEALIMRVFGSKIVAMLTDHHALHHLGFAKGRIKRQILPGKRLNAPIVDAIKAVFTRYMRKKLGQ